MARRRMSRSKTLFTRAGVFVIVFIAVFFGVQFFTKTGVFHVPGVVHYDDSLSEAEKNTLQGIFTDEIVLDSDVTVSARYTLEKPELQTGEYIYNIYVPVADFYSTDTNVDISDPNSAFIENGTSEMSYIFVPIEELDFKKRLLSLNDTYYLDSFDKGAIFRIVKFDSGKFDDEIAPLVEGEFKKDIPTKDTVLSFAQTGVTAMSRGMNKKLVEVGGDATYFSANIGDFLSGFDLTHTSNESSFTNLATSENICSDTRFIDTLKAIGLDIVELTGNHNQDCGIEAAEQSIDIYEQNGIKIVGGGKNAEAAAVPLQIQDKGNNITMLAYNQSTGGATLGDTPGANQYYEEDAAQRITAAKERGDFVIVDVQYFECSAYVSETEDATCDYANSSAGDQIGFFRHLIDLGADMVVGTSAHQPQTFELYGNGAIYYGLGNLFFDQVWWPGTTRSLILGNYFYKGKLLQTKITPTVYDDNMQTRILDEETAKWFLERLSAVRP